MEHENHSINITFEEARENAAKAVLNADAGVPATQQETLTDRFANFWTNLHAAWLRRCIRADRALVAGMPEAIDAQKQEAWDEYQDRLKQIEALADLHVAEAKRDIAFNTAKLRRLGHKA